MLEAIRSLFRYRGTRVITCPETGHGEAVQVDAPHAAWTNLTGHGHLRLDSCTRWPERQGCAESCLRQIEAAPDGCLVQKVLQSWYTGKACVYCHKPFGLINWADHHPTLMSQDLITQDMVTRTWSEIAPRDLPDTLKTSSPVCWNCHIAETFRREHPELVTDRNWQH